MTFSYRYLRNYIVFKLRIHTKKEFFTSILYSSNLMKLYCFREAGITLLRKPLFPNKSFKSNILDTIFFNASLWHLKIGQVTMIKLHTAVYKLARF